ncbi:hypothetical protein HNQ51_000840 [Inhella inkyongensis]|uniref:Uncharacterized protein n=1 Tax=Inhella inkyongensis TaxID=392593 RepID=A0A840RXW6_9BURK|nr:hypothetical protein [Inhella inkyongensis]MBB5203547.1 hypothetical protein [Inhella inkyongensis]
MKFNLFRRTKSLRPSASDSLRERIGQHTVVTFNVGPLGEACVVLALKPIDYRTTSPGAVFAKTVPDSPQRYRVLIARDGLVEADTFIEGEPFNIHEVQPLGTDEILLACGRSCYRGPNDFEINGRVYSRDGRFLRAILLGDGIQNLQATRRGALWVAYFDEGIFGNFGWREPVGAAGLVAFDAQGERLYEFEPTGGLEAISDCYALNVASDEDVWCCYYTDFPLVHLRDRQVVSSWKSPVEGAHAFAVGEGHALFAGGYGNRHLFRLVQLGPQGSARVVGEFELRDNAGAAIEAMYTVGRGSSLHLLGDGIVHRLDLKDVLSQLRG